MKKNIFKAVYTAALLTFVSCGGSDNGSSETHEANTNNETVAEVKEYDCDCTELSKKPNGKKIKVMTEHVGKAFKGAEPFNGTCANFTDDKAHKLYGLATFKNGYRDKYRSYSYDTGERLLTTEFEFDENDMATGWFMQLSRTGSDHDGILYVRNYREYEGVKLDKWNTDLETVSNGDIYYGYSISSLVTMDYKTTTLQVKYLKDQPISDARVCAVDGVSLSEEKEALLDFFQCVESEGLKKFFFKE